MSERKDLQDELISISKEIIRELKQINTYHSQKRDYDAFKLADYLNQTNKLGKLASTFKRLSEIQEKGEQNGVANKSNSECVQRSDGISEKKEQ